MIYLTNRLNEPTTWAGLVAVLSAFIFHWSPEQQSALAMLGAALFAHQEGKS